MKTPKCLWDAKPFAPSGRGKMQLFCSLDCRRGFDRGLRAYGTIYYYAGAVSISDLKEATDIWEEFKENTNHKTRLEILRKAVRRMS